jgi:Predicted transcriptional regulators
VERIVGSIGLKVFSHRKRMGLSLQQLGERSDVSAAAIHKIEQGGMVPTITTCSSWPPRSAGRSPTSWRRTSARTTWPS